MRRNTLRRAEVIFIWYFYVNSRENPRIFLVHDNDCFTKSINQRKRCVIVIDLVPVQGIITTSTATSFGTWPVVHILIFRPVSQSA